MLLIKLSIVTLYRRIFAMTSTLYLCAFLAICYFNSCTVTYSACCQPPLYFWTRYANPASPGRCVFDLYTFHIVTAAVNTSTDVLILIIPIQPVWKLQMRTVQKALVLGIFSLGSFPLFAVETQ
ncbi:hypothetical protein BDW68DRAFT_175720 [Aspergillus falconensis]